MATSSIITLTTDFGQGSHYVAQMKGAVLAVDRQAAIVDVCHTVPPQNVRYGAVVLDESTRVFPPQSIHIAVVDPGVGSQRRIIYAQIGDQQYIAPDNGLLSLLVQRRPPAKLVSLTEPRFWRPTVSSTFHARDIMAPAAAHLGLGLSPDELGETISQIAQLDWPQPRTSEGRIRGEVLTADSFGNLITNIAAELLPASSAGGSPVVYCQGRRIAGVSNTYGDGASGELVALIGSSGRLEIAVVNGDAAATLAAGAGASVEIRWQERRIQELPATAPC